jgi:hypothetical protein
MRSFVIRHSRKIIYSILAITATFGVGRLYYELTDGFWESNIKSELQANDKRLNAGDEKLAAQILNQPFHYLAKGCQAYCFISEDGQYVLKFFKYQRYQTSPFLEPFRFIPKVDKYVKERKAHKMEKLEFFMQAWVIASQKLSNESGLIYVHLNKSDHLKKPIVIYDKLGMKHVLESDQMEFLIQRTAEPLTKKLVKVNNEDGKALIDDLLNILVQEYKMGVGDHDPALLQNTGAYNNKPFHIDVGQFYLNPSFQSEKGYYQDLFNRTYEMREWLKERRPELEQHLTQKLKEIIGEDFNQMKPFFGRFRD